MSGLRYDAPVDPGASNTSHALVIDLVGHARRVLDVGCATGRLGEVLRARGCDVVGVEVDEGAAELARARLSDVVVADLESTHLTSLFPVGSFDVVILADVLEHLRDPRRLLRAAVELLQRDGFVVVSLPNVAHAAVRLALLQGRFPYSETGLLDSTHLRFFTWDNVVDLLAEAGLAAVEVRRTTAGTFETEIAIDRDDVDPVVVERLTREPEASTYQYVVKAVRDDARRAVAALAARAEAQAARIRTLEAELSAASPPGTGWPVGALQVGLWGAFDVDEPAGALRAAVHRHELERRLPDAVVRTFAPLGILRESLPLPLPLEPLREPTDARRQELASALDCAILTGPVSSRLDELIHPYGPVPLEETHPATFLGRAPGDDGLPRLYSAISTTIDGARSDDGVLLDALRRSRLVAVADAPLAERLQHLGISATLVADPLLLTDRLPDVFGEVRRATLTTGLGRLDRLRYLLVHGDAASVPHVHLVVRALRRLQDEHGDLTVVLVNFGGVTGEGAFGAAVKEALPAAETLGRSLDAYDVVAAIAGAQLLVSSASWARSVASAFDVPSLSPGDQLGAFADAAVLLRKLERPESVPAPLVAELDRHFDELAAAVRSLRSSDRQAVAPTVADRMAALARAEQERTAWWWAACNGLVERTSVPEEALERPRAPVEEDDGGHNGAAARELEALLATRTFRLTRRARSVYGRLRRFLP